MSSIGPIANLAGSSQQAGSKVPQHVLVVDASGNPATFGGSGGTSEADSASFTATSTLGTPVMGAYESTPDQLTSGQLGIIGLDVDRNVKVNVVAGGTAGTQYTEGDTDASITGTATLMEGAGNALVPLQGTAADGLLVNLGSNNDVTVTGAVAVSGTVTVTGDSGGSLTVDAPVGTPVFVRLSDGSAAISTLPVSLASVPSHAVTNAGTFAVQESGGALTALQIIDDWDESDRAKVNPIVGQAGVAAGAGASGATTQRVILATDGQPGAGTFGHNQVSVSTTATLIVAARAGRRAVTVVQHGTTIVYLGATSGVTTSNGVALIGTAGSAVTLDYTGDVYGIVGSGSNTVSYAEIY